MNGLCDQKGCKTRSTVRPRLLFFPPGVLHSPAVGTLSSEFCADCGAALRVDDFIWDESWAKICDGFDQRGKVRPARESVQLSLVAVLHAEDN